MRNLPAASAALALALSAAVASAQTGPNDARARDILKQLIEINTTDTPRGNITTAAEAMAARLRTAGFPEADVKVLGPDPRKGNLIARYRGTGARKPILLIAHLDVVEARREDWSFDPFTFLEKDGYFYGRGTTDDKSMAAHFVANLIRLKEEGFKPDRDLILALTADEEGGDFNGPAWLLKNHRDLIDAEFAINEGGGGSMRKGKYLTNEIQGSEKVYQDFRLETRNAGGHSSLPVKDNAITHLSQGLARLGAFDFPVELNDVTRGYFEKSATIETDPKVYLTNEVLAPLDLAWLWASGIMWERSNEGGGRGVVVVHGFFAVDGSTKPLRDYLSHHGYRIFRSGIGINADCLNESLTTLITSCERAVADTGREIIGIGHSLGGMLVRAAATRRPDLFSQVIVLGSPINSIRVAPQMRLPHGIVAEILAAKGCGYGPDCGCGAVRAFRAPFPDSVDHHSVYTLTDGVVSPECCLEEEEARNHLVHSTHSSLPWNPEVLQLVRTLLNADLDIA